jgi:hypothetical protein
MELIDDEDEGQCSKNYAFISTDPLCRVGTKEADHQTRF